MRGVDFVVYTFALDNCDCNCNLTVIINIRLRIRIYAKSSALME